MISDEKDNNEINDVNVKKIIIIDNNENKNLIKKIKNTKEKKLKVETETWGLCDEDLSHELQLEFLNIVSNKLHEYKKNKYCKLIDSHIKAKISSYKQQDLVKKMYNSDLFVSYEEVVRLLLECDLKCHYCSSEVFLLYKFVREHKQWSLDRINNDIGHNQDNLVIACLECNLKRRRTNKDAFLFTKNLKINREGFVS
jgi:hypothetical protein